ncbi:FISUMP domain-containing protein [Maribellus sp. YY47]|uniref:FISUMP domain-containing protein n=1 Tax=Maribellus sp. YY47 TaxID=2929486 RepID=UPI0020009BDB|nr:FISUMP domain-containing protein [Maribellus sp. YY47]MCK3683982.1 hypothetical protein [Maribellus sp. YY47]
MKIKHLCFALILLVCACSDSSSDDEKIVDFSGDSGIFIDQRDGHRYNWIKIGEQVWMADNLAYLPDGVSLTDSPFAVFEYNGDNPQEARKSEGYKEYGVFYNYYAANEFCPEGWHLPSNAEWEHLAEFISEDNGGFEKQEETKYDLEGWFEVGKQLKIVTSVYETNGTDNYGFSALLPGIIEGNGSVSSKGQYGRFWTATEENEGRTYARFVKSSSSLLYTTHLWKTSKLSVRCVKD